MARRSRKPDEALGPAVDGTEDVENLARYLDGQPDEPEEVWEVEAPPEPQKPQVVLLCGNGDVALPTARLAAACGFVVELARKEDPMAEDELAALAEVTHVLNDYDDFVSACDIDRNHYVCVFAEDAADCSRILSQCLASEAAYLGVCADEAMSGEILGELKAAGAPDAELAAICCPMGLNLGAEGPEQMAVSIVAELLAARSGVLKRLRFAD